MASKLHLFDTHCHIHFDDYPLDVEQVIVGAKEQGVSSLMLVGCSLEDSQAAPVLAAQHKNTWVSIGLHPHEAKRYVSDIKALNSFKKLVDRPKVVAIGETGLDYYYLNSPKKAQEQLFRFQLELAQEQDLPLIFHVRDAFTDFWRIFDDYSGIDGVIHSFSSNRHHLDEALSRGLYIGLNGIMTFTKRADQLEAAKQVPLDRLLLETDAPFLTPSPLRGKICEPKHVRVTAEFLADLRGETLEYLAKSTTANARKLFRL